MDYTPRCRHCCLICLSSSDQIPSCNSVNSKNMIILKTCIKSELDGDNFHGEVEVELGKNEKQSALLTDHLRVVFLLKNLLEIPNETLEKYLENWGNPMDWIWLCDNCHNMVQKAWGVYEGVLDTMSRLATFRNNIVKEMRTTRVSRIDSVGDNIDLEVIMEDVGNFVNTKIYSGVTITYPIRSGSTENLQGSPSITPKHETTSDHDEEHTENQEDSLLFYNNNVEWQPDNEDYDKNEAEHENSDDDYFPEERKKKRKNRKLVLTDHEFDCKFCGKQCSNEHGLSVHLGRSHGKETRSERYVCEYEGCGKEFKWKQSLNDHMAKHRNEARFKCNICGREFYKSASLKYHQDAHKRNTIPQDFNASKLHSLSKKSDSGKLKILDEEVISSTLVQNPDLNCKFCGKVYENKHALGVHIGKKHGKNSLKNQKLICTVEGCTKVYQARQAFDIHMAKHRKEPRYRCILCKKEFYERGSFLYHKAAHQRRNFRTKKVKKTGKLAAPKCPVLTKKAKDQDKFYYNNDTEWHPNNANNEPDNNENQEEHDENSNDDDDIVTHEQFGCKLCGKRCSNEHGLSVHIGRNHGKETRSEKYICKIEGCGKEFKWKKSFNDHMAKHIYKTRFKCGICGKEFFYKSSFDYHQEAHKRRTISSTLNEDGKKAPGRKTDFHLNKSYSSTCSSKESDGNIPKILDEEIISSPSVENQDLNCKFCGKVYENKHALGVHIGKTHNKYSIKQKGLICTVEGCLKKYQSRQAYEIHLAKHRKEPRFRCILCGKEFYERANFLYHKTAHQRGTIPLSTLSKLQVQKNDKKKIVCDIEGCGKEFAWVHTYRAHMVEIHRHEKGYHCGQCGKKFYRKTTYLHHKKIHKRNPISVPAEIKAKSTDSETPVGEVSTMEFCNPKPYICELCGNGFATEQTLKAHKRKTKLHMPAHKLSQFKCVYCGREFQTKNTLTYHLLKHKDEKKGNSAPSSTTSSFQCQHCGNSFRNKGQLAQHVKSHFEPTYKREYNSEPAETHICDLCGKKFRKIEYLRIHKRFIHENKWVAFCKICGKGMRSQQHLRLHMRISHKIFEEGVKTFKCKVQGCVRRFFDELRFKEHMQKYHPSGGEGDPHPFTCHHCGKGFWSISRLNTHLLTRQHLDPEGKRRRRKKNVDS